MTHRDLLMRFGIELIFSLCEHYGAEIVIFNASSLAKFEDEIEDINGNNYDFIGSPLWKSQR